MKAPLIFWFRQDLRLADNPGLLGAIESGQPLVPLYINNTDQAVRPVGGAGNWWRHHSLLELRKNLQARGADLIFRRGPAEQVLLEVIAESGASGVAWSRCYEPDAIARDTKIKARLTALGLTADSYNSALLFEPWQLETKTGNPFQVFTPFWKAARAASLPRPPVPVPQKVVFHKGVKSDQLESYGWQAAWAAGFTVRTPGEAGALQRLAEFAGGGMAGYSTNRDRPDRPGTSGLSPHLHWGEVGPRQVWRAVQAGMARGKIDAEDGEKFLAELGWREFAHHLLFHFPSLPDRPLQPKFARFGWRDDAAGLAAWQRGQTGYPLIDAGMRQLWQTGWMHNRVRMITASFLVKDLLVDWRLGEEWFWDTLVDADLANNVVGWQWVAGSGPDAAPYFRVFNPVLQGEKFDPEGDYVRQYVPELARLPASFIHRPWEAPVNVLRESGIELGVTYPRPIVDHRFARERALAALKELTA